MKIKLDLEDLCWIGHGVDYWFREYYLLNFSEEIVIEEGSFCYFS